MRVLSITTGFITFLETTSWLVPLLIVVGLVVVIVFSAWLFRYIKPTSPEQKKDVVSLLLQTLGGVAFILGAWFTWQQLITSREELAATQKAQVTEHFTRAIEQLGKGDEEAGDPQKKGATDSGKNLAIRLGGIYALERISKESDTYYPAVVDVLTAFVRQNAAAKGDETVVKVSPDIQAILSVLGRRRLSYGQGETQRLDLSSTDLSGADLVKAKLAGANLTSVRFKEARLNGALLNGAQMSDARLAGAFLEGADLRGADLRGANLQGAYVAGADFSGADLSAVNLQGAQGLTAAQINSAKSCAGVLTDSVLCQKP
jgi:uncharacterized protein YjbI with pentapeptide repeats